MADDFFDFGFSSVDINELDVLKEKEQQIQVASGEAGEMQVSDPEIGLVHNIGGVGLYGNVTILGR